MSLDVCDYSHNTIVKFRSAATGGAPVWLQLYQWQKAVNSEKLVDKEDLQTEHWQKLPY